MRQHPNEGDQAFEVRQHFGQREVSEDIGGR